MDIAVIILGLFIVLLVVVIYKQGRIIKAKDNQIEAIKAEIVRLKTTTESNVVVWVLDELLEFINNQK